MTAFSLTVSSEFSPNSVSQYQMFVTQDILGLCKAFFFFLSFPPDGHHHENYSEMHPSYSGNKVYIQFYIIEGKFFFWCCYFQ